MFSTLLFEQIYWIGGERWASTAFQQQLEWNTHATVSVARCEEPSALKNILNL